MIGRFIYHCNGLWIETGFYRGILQSMKKVTIQDIARVSGVSKSTVSRVLNGTAQVNPEKTKAVLEATKRLGFQPNVLAQSLASGRSSTIGVLTQMIGSPFYDAISQGLISGLSGTSYSPIFADGRWEKVEQKDALQALVGRRVDGLVLIGGTLSSVQVSEITGDLPVLLVARKCDLNQIRSISVNNELGAYQANKHLIDCGHQRIALIRGLSDHGDAADRINGYKRAILDAGLSQEEDLIVDGDFSADSGVQGIEILLDKGIEFTAVFAANDLTAYGARLALSRVGLRVPEDVAVVGFDDQMESRYMTPPLSSVRQPAREMGEQAATAMVQLLGGGDFESVEVIPELVIRQSSDMKR